MVWPYRLTPVLFLKENGIFHRAGVTQLVECDLAKVDVAGSNPVSLSIVLPTGSVMIKHLLLLACAALACAQQYKVEPISSASPGLPAAYASVVDATGYRVIGSSGPWCEIWFRKSIPTGAKPSDAAIAFPIAQGTLLGIIRFPAVATDRRGQNVKPGVYTMRYSNFPVDGAHQGVAPQRDFALLTPMANDADPNAAPDFDKLVAQSKTSGTAHAAVMSLEPPGGTTFPSITKEGDADWSLAVKVGDVTIAIIVAGTAGG